MSTFTSLSKLNVGDQAVVGDLSECTPDYRRLLAQMGILPGTPITVTRKAPLGDPVEIELRGYRLSLRKKEALPLPLIKVRSPHEAF